VFFCSSVENSFCDNYWGLSVSFSVRTSAVLCPKPLDKDLVPAISSACSHTASSAQLNVITSLHPWHSLPRKGALIKFSGERKKQIGTKSSQNVMQENGCGLVQNTRPAQHATALGKKMTSVSPINWVLVKWKQEEEEHLQ